MQPIPQPTELTRPFWTGCRRGELRLQRCAKCEKFRFFPSEGCNGCGHPEYEWKTVAGTARVYTWIVVHRPVDENWAADVPFAVVVGRLNLPGHPLLTGRFGGTLTAVAADLPIVPQFKPINDEIALLEWVPA